MISTKSKTIRGLIKFLERLPQNSRCDVRGELIFYMRGCEVVADEGFVIYVSRTKSSAAGKLV